MNRSRTFAKVALLFFAVLFTAVLIHPDVDLLDVHDVKINSARSKADHGERPLIPQLPVFFARPEVNQSSWFNGLQSEDQNLPLASPVATRILRV